MDSRIIDVERKIEQKKYCPEVVEDIELLLEIIKEISLRKKLLIKEAQIKEKLIKKIKDTLGVEN